MFASSPEITSPPTVLVTGAAKRLGREIALKLAAQGWRVAVHYRDSVEEARATAEDCAKVARFMAADFAEAVLPIFERERPRDDRPRKSIAAARALARGEIGTAAGTAGGNSAFVPATPDPSQSASMIALKAAP